MTSPPAALRVAYVLLEPPRYSETFIQTEIEAVRASGAEVGCFVAREPIAGRVGARLAVSAVTVARGLTQHPITLAGRVGRLASASGPRDLLAATYAAQLRRELSAFAPDVIHAHFVNLPAAIAVLLGDELGRPVTAMAHAADFLLDRDRTALDRRLGRLSHLFVISAATAEQLRGRGVDLSRIAHSVVRAAYDERAGDAAASGVRVEAARTVGVVRLVTVARLVEKKGIGTAVEAVRRLVARGQDVRYDVYGDGPLRLSLRRQADQGGVGDRVAFHGAVGHAEALRAVAGADLAVLPCQYGSDGDVDGLPVFLMEAASLGIPVVTTAVSGVPELVTEHGGWLAPPKDPDALADLVSQALRHPDESRRRAQVLRERLSSEFAPSLQADRLLAVWRQLANPARRRG